MKLFKRNDDTIKVIVVAYIGSWRNMGEMSIERATEEYPNARLFFNTSEAQQFLTANRNR